ncbi:glycosyltransferase family 4 protein [Acidihalobacter prosperus]
MAASSPPRIALIRQRYTDLGGAERFVAGAIEALVAKNTQVSVITRYWLSQAGTDVICVNPFYLGRLWRDWSFARAACKLVRSSRFELVQSHERISCCDIYRAGDGVHRVWLNHRVTAEGWLARLKVWLNPYHHYIRFAEKRLFKSDRLKVVVCNSMMVRDEINACFGFPKERIEVIYNAVDTLRFTPGIHKQHRKIIRDRLGLLDSDLVYLFVGSGFARKGLAACIKALASLPEHCHLVVVGKDRATSRYQRMSRKLGVDIRVHFAGPQSDTTPYYGMADIFVFPTLYDPFPNVVLEALACGLPVLISDSCGAVDIIRDGENGFVCSAFDLDSLIVRMKRLMNSELREKLKPISRALVEDWQPDTMSEQLLNVYQRIIGSSDTTDR